MEPSSTRSVFSGVDRQAVQPHLFGRTDFYLECPLFVHSDLVLLRLIRPSIANLSIKLTVDHDQKHFTWRKVRSCHLE